jgi:D-serine dehydratase
MAGMPPATLDLDALLDTALPSTLKALPRAAVGRRLRDLGGLGLSLLDGDLPLPAAVLADSAIAHNEAWMRAFTARTGASLCPHGKTTMAPQLFARQLAAGAWGLTAATACHVRSYRHFGVPRIVLANQLVTPADIGLVLDELEADADFDFYALVDSAAGLDALLHELRRRPQARPLQLLLEVGTSGGRTGVRSVDEGLALGRLVRDAAPAVALRGIECFEGIAGGAEHARVELVVLTMLETVATLARIGCDEGWFAEGEVLLSAGGSQFFDLAASVLGAVQAQHALRVVLRSGCYLSHDALHYERMAARLRQRSAGLLPLGPGLRNALWVWAAVQSLPEAGRAICTLGKRDASYDIELPRPLLWYRRGLHTAPQPVDAGPKVVALNDQHAHVVAGDGGALPWQVGDLVGFGVGHPCTTFDKWPLLFTVDDAWRITGGVRTFF